MNGVTAIRPGVSWDEYTRLPGVSITRLKELRRSPLHFRYRMGNPKESAPLAFGRAAHCAVLEPERFGSDFAVWDRRTAGGSMAPRNGKHWDGFREANTGREIITADQQVEVLALQAAVRSNPDAMALLAAGDPEVTLQWMEGATQAKGRVDWLTTHEGAPALVGLKTTRDCRPFQFGRQSANLGYHLQWAFYLEGYKAITGEAAHVFEIVVEAEPPHAVVVYEIPVEVLLQGAAEYTDLLDLLSECQRSNQWPGPVQGIHQLSLPAWAYGEEEISYADE